MRCPPVTAFAAVCMGRYARFMLAREGPTPTEALPSRANPTLHTYPPLGCPPVMRAPLQQPRSQKALGHTVLLCSRHAREPTRARAPQAPSSTSAPRGDNPAQTHPDGSLQALHDLCAI